MSGKKEIVASTIFIVMLLVVFSSLVSAGIFDWFKKLTGQATSQTFNASIQITGTAPAFVNFISAVAATAPIESNPRQIYLEIHVNDSDGVSDVNTTSIHANFSRNTVIDTESVRENTSCLYKGTIDAYTANFTCYVDMQYWDANGTWNISVRGKDLGAGTYNYNLSNTFSYTQLKAMAISPAGLGWAAAASAATNKTAVSNLTVNNTGNYNGSITITGVDLVGQSTGGVLPTSNFTMSTLTGAGNPECNRTSPAAWLVNNTAVTVVNSYANRGNLSVTSTDFGWGQEKVSFCIPHVPLVSSQLYTSVSGGNWTVSY